ncbi:MAG: pilin [Gammaproteobacteria bacterium]
MFCSQCGTKNEGTAQFCASCGAKLPDGPAEVVNQAAAPQAGSSQDPSMEALEAAVGYKNAHYYLPRFKRFEDQGVGVSWHWPAFFISFYWLLYRKMWGWAVLYFLMPFPVGIVAGLAMMESESAGTMIYLAYWLAMFTLFPMYANAIYYRHLKKKIEKAKVQTTDGDKQLRMIGAWGGTSGAAIIGLLVLVIPMIGIMAAIAIPAYQDYTVRSQVAEALNVATPYKILVEDYAFENQEWPQSIADIGGAQHPDSAYIEEIAVVENGIIVVYLAGNPEIEGGSVGLVPYQDDQGNILWECGGADVANKYLPANCRE